MLGRLHVPREGLDVTDAQWTHIVANFHAETVAMSSSNLILIAVNPAQLEALATAGYDAGNPETWINADVMQSRMDVLLAVVLDEIDRRLPVPT